MYIQCLIKRADDSDTFVDFQQVRYRFTKNEAGHHVCFVGSEAHQKRLLAMGPSSYIIYPNPEGLEAQHQGNAPEAMTKQAIMQRKAANPPKDPGEHTAAPEAVSAQAPAQTPIIDFDWSLDEKVAKTKEFKFLKPDKFKDYVDNHREQVMKWPLDVRRELAKKLDKVLPELDPGIEGFVIDDYLRGGSPGNT